MKEALKVLLLFLCAAAAQGAPSVALPPNDDPIRFTTNDATKSSYKNFIEALRSRLAAGTVHDIPVLVDPTTLEERNRYVVVELSNSETETIQVGIDLTNVYAVAYRAGSESYFFRDAPSSASTYLFTDTNGHTLRFNSTYGDLTRWGNRSREETPLGLDPLRHAISFLSSGADDDKERAQTLLVIIQMVSEAARFRHISTRVGQSIQSGESFQPHNSLVRLENEWGALSENVQLSDQGTFPNAVSLINIRNENIDVGSLSHPVIAGLALILFYCRQPDSINHQYSPPPMIIRSVVEPPPGTCDIYEPTIRISGRDGMCVDVSSDAYNDGNPIILWTCKDQLEDNQLWTVKSDKTIRSKGKCLTTSGYAQGDHVAIYDCDCVVREATQWEIWENGTIINPQSGLALTSQFSAKGGTLTVEKNEYYMRQGWRTGNDTSAFVTAISGYLDLCMEAHGSDVWLADCDTSKDDQQWAVYSDDSIRPVQNTNNCLTSADHKQGATIVMMDCSNGWASQRWVFKVDDGTIYSLYDNMVMDVKNSDPSLKQIILWQWTGNDNQIWLPLV